MIKVNDIVKVKDGSYSAEFMEGKLVDAFPCAGHSREWKVLAVNCKLPTDEAPHFRDDYPNDTIIAPCNELDRIVFIHSGFLLSPVYPKYCCHCGAELKQK